MQITLGIMIVSKFVIIWRRGEGGKASIIFRDLMPRCLHEFRFLWTERKRTRKERQKIEGSLSRSLNFIPVIYRENSDEHYHRDSTLYFHIVLVFHGKQVNITSQQEDTIREYPKTARYRFRASQNLLPSFLTFSLFLSLSLCRQAPFSITYRELFSSFLFSTFIL